MKIKIKIKIKFEEILWAYVVADFFLMCNIHVFLCCNLPGRLNWDCVLFFRSGGKKDKTDHRENEEDNDRENGDLKSQSRWLGPTRGKSTRFPARQISAVFIKKKGEKSQTWLESRGWWAQRASPELSTQPVAGGWERWRSRSLTFVSHLSLSPRGTRRPYRAVGFSDLRRGQTLSFSTKCRQKAVSVSPLAGRDGSGRLWEPERVYELRTL